MLKVKSRGNTKIKQWENNEEKMQISKTPQNQIQISNSQQTLLKYERSNPTYYRKT